MNPFLLLLPCLLSLLCATVQQPSFVVQPYLQYATQNSIRIHWETAAAASTMVEYSAAVINSRQPSLSEKSTVEGDRLMHHVLLDHLTPQTKYFYRTVSVLPSGDSIISSINTFETAVADSSAFAFAVFSDSQNDWKAPEAWKRVSTQAYKERPNFAVHAGDLVDLGYMKDDWVNEFFGQSNLFMKTIPIFSIPGNHEHDAAYYYQYMYVPQPYFYSFKYGNAEFFMIDTDQYQEKGTDLFNAVELALAKSTAYWKFVVHHHPPFSSDDDDFGNTYAEASTLGDDEVRSVVPLYEKHGVDIVFYGHIHTYERSWPISNKKTVKENGVLYLNIGGAGGSLENAAPTRSWFTNKLRTAHHFGYISIHHDQLNFQAIDENGNIFDSFNLKGSRYKKNRNVSPVALTVQTSRRLFTDSIHIRLLTAHNNNDIRYTTDGSEPNKSSKKYSAPVVLTRSSNIKATAYNAWGKSRTTSYQFNKEAMQKAATVIKPERGLQYQYFTGQLKDGDTAAFSKVSISAKGVVNNLDLDEVKHPRQYWGAIFTGYIYVAQDGYYKFEGHADHRLRLTINDRLLFDEEDREINYWGEMYLQKGYHPVTIDYYNSREGRAFMELYYTGPGIERQAIPHSVWWRE